jgi:hypothetical protein
MSQIDFSPENISKLSQQAVDKAIEQHRLSGHAIAVSDDQGNPIEIRPEGITPLAEKLQQRQQQPLPQP